MRICGQVFDTGMLNRIQEEIEKDQTHSRRELSRRVCTWLEWKAPNGKLQDMSCRKALLELNQRGLIQLPEIQASYSFQRRQPAIPIPDLENVEGEIVDLGAVRLVRITSRYSKDSRLWRALVEEHHYLGHRPLCGAQIRYLILSSKRGVLGALAFTSATWALKARDEYIGWSESARLANLGRVVCNSRFLILPMVKVGNLASHVLRLAREQVPDDWENQYLVRPVLLETFVDPIRFQGTCYTADNWIDVGFSSDRRDGQPKMIYLHPLAHDWRETLCAERRRRLCEGPRPERATSWGEEEFGTVELYDERLKRRLYTVADDFYAQPTVNIPEACGGFAKTKAVYRFFQNEKITMDVLLRAHKESTVERIQKYPVVLVPQDTTTLNYSAHPETEGLGPINDGRCPAIGLILHDTLAFTEDGTPLGVLDAQCWARDPVEEGKKHLRHELPIEQKESMKWLRSFRAVQEVQEVCPETMLVSMGDREADIYELFLEAQKKPGNPKLLVRAERSRNRKVEQEHLWTYMERQELAGSIGLHIPRSGTRKARDARLDIRFAEVTLTPPKRGGFRPIDIWAVYAQEKNAAGEVANPVEWMLLTTAAVNNLEDAKKRLEWYSGRWGIELFHRTLKSGCRIENRQLASADSLEACLGLDMVVAWRIYHMTMLGREHPDHPCTIFFNEIEWRALYCFVKKTTALPASPPSMSVAIRMVASLGGFLGRKCDKNPGIQTIWRGMAKVEVIAEAYAIFVPSDVRPPPSLAP